MARAERTYYLIFSLYCFSWSFLGPMYSVFLLSRGLDLFQMSVVPAIYFLVSLIFEVPTGAFADLVGRKASFVLSCALRMLAFGMYAFADHFSQFAFAEFIDALGSTLATGALDAWAVDRIRSEGSNVPADRLFARAQIFARPLMIVAAVLSGYMAMYDLTIPWFAAATAFAVTGVVALARMKETGERSAPPWASMHRSVGRTVREGLAEVWRAPGPRFLCLLTLGTAFGAMPVNMLWQPRMQELTGAAVWMLGWVSAALNVSSLLGSALVTRFAGQFRRERQLCAAALWRAVMFATIALATTTGPVLGGLVLQEMSFGMSEPVMQAWMNDHIVPKRRATVLSVRAMFFTLGAALGLVSIGWVARDLGLPAAWLAFASIFALLAPAFILLGRLSARHPIGAAPVGLAGSVDGVQA